MLDVARHFFGVDDVKHYIDLIALYKLNRLHLHLSDDQGWRIEVKSWPNLTKHGASTQVGGGAGGFYTQEQYADLVKYAQDRFITIVPEIDVPGHTNAALASYPELNCDGNAPALYSGIEVGFSTLCVDKEITYKFIADLVNEIGAITAGPYFHVGGDEVQKLTPQQFVAFIERVQTIVAAQGRQMVGWGDIAPARLLPTTIVQHWRPEASHVAAAKGVKFIVSPASKSYLDHKYDKTTVLGLNWAGEIEVRMPTNGIPSTCSHRIPQKRFWVWKHRSGPRRSRRWKTSSTWPSRGCPPPLKSAGHRPRRDNGRTSAGVSPLTGRGGRRSASISIAHRRCRGSREEVSGREGPVGPPAVQCDPCDPWPRMIRVIRVPCNPCDPWL